MQWAVIPHVIQPAIKMATKLNKSSFNIIDKEGNFEEYVSHFVFIIVSVDG